MVSQFMNSEENGKKNYKHLKNILKSLSFNFFRQSKLISSVLNSRRMMIIFFTLGI